MSGYYSLNKKGEYEKSARLAHATVFLWQDGWEKNKIFSQATRQIALDMAEKTQTMVLDLKKEFIYSNNGLSYRFSKGIAAQCAAYVRSVFFSRAGEKLVPALSKSWIRRKRRMLMKFSSKFASSPEHVGVLYGNMAKAITNFRTNIRSDGETKHTGWVVGIQKNLYSSDPISGDRRKQAKFFLKNDKYSKKRERSKSKKILLHDKLSYLEFGSDRQIPRHIYIYAIMEYLKEMGFDVPGSSVKLLDPGTTKKAKMKKGSKVEKVVAEDIRMTLLKSRWKNRHRLKITNK